MLEDIQVWLEAQQLVGKKAGWPCFRGYMPAYQKDVVPEQVVVLTERAAGPAPLRSGSHPKPRGLQVRIRTAAWDQDGGLDHIRAIYKALCGIRRNTIGSTNIRWVEAHHASPIPLGADKSGRFEFSWNFTIAASAR